MSRQRPEAIGMAHHENFSRQGGPHLRKQFILYLCSNMWDTIHGAVGSAR